MIFLLFPTISEASLAYTVPPACNKYVDEIEKYNWDTALVLKIMMAESSCNPNAKNLKDKHRGCIGSYGLMQIACLDGVIYDPAYNIKVAYEQKYLKGGWRHWGVCTNGKVDCGLILKPQIVSRSLLLAEK